MQPRRAEATAAYNAERCLLTAVWNPVCGTFAKPVACHPPPVDHAQGDTVAYVISQNRPNYYVSCGLRIHQRAYKWHPQGMRSHGVRSVIVGPRVAERWTRPVFDDAEMRGIPRKMITKTRIIAALVIPVGVALSIAAPANAAPSDGNSPGVVSGNATQVPVHVPVNTCGNTVNVIGALNPAFGNACANG